MNSYEKIIGTDTEVSFLPYPYIDRKRRPILFRKVTYGDRLRIIKMYQDFEPKGIFQGLPPADPENMELWISSMLKSGFNIAGISFDQKVICHAAIFDIDGCRSDFILAVLPSYQDSGIGIQLTRIIKKAAHELGFKNVWLCVESYNMKAKHIYSKLGFNFIHRVLNEECEMLLELKPDPAMQVPVSRIMTRNVLTLREGQTAKYAIKMFLNLGISGLPVVDSSQRLAGFLTETDVLESWTGERSLDEIMTRDVVYVDKDAHISKIVMLIADRGVKQIPVVQGEDRILAGIVSRKDILKHLYVNDYFY